MGACGVCRIWGAAPHSAAAASRAGAAPGCWRWFCAGSPPRLHCGALWLLLSAISGLPGSAWSRTCCLCLRCSVNEPGRVHHRAASCLFHPDQFLDEVLWRKKAVLQLMLHLVPTSLSWSCGLQHPAAHSMEHGILRGDGGQLSFAAEFPGKEFPATAALFPKDSISRNFPLSPPPPSLCWRLPLLFQVSLWLAATCVETGAERIHGNAGLELVLAGPQCTAPICTECPEPRH